MALRGAAIAVSILLIGGSAGRARAEHGLCFSHQQQEPQQSDLPEVFVTDHVEQIDRPLEKLPEMRWNGPPITMRPAALATLVDTLAGRPVRLVYARVVGVFDPRVFLVESQTALRPTRFRNRVLVFIETGALRVDPASLVASTVTIFGVARTLLGMQAGGEVPWPDVLTRDAVRRLDIEAAVLAASVRTPEGVNLLEPSSAGRTPVHVSSPHR